MSLTQKISPYWICQCIGWGLATSYWVYFMIIDPNMTFMNGFTNTLLTVLACIGITHSYYLVAHKYGWHRLEIKQLLPRVILGTIFMAFLFVIIMIPLNFMTGAKCLDCNFVAHVNEGWLRYSMTGLRLMAIWTLAFHMYHYAQHSARIKTEKAILAEKVSSAQIEKLKAQLNPHFLFNALNSVKSLIASDQNKARRATVLLSDILRNSLNASKQKMISLDVEIQQVKDYLELEKIRFEERLNINYDIDPAALAFQVPPMSVQILIENAIKHGISTSINGGEVSLKIKLLEQTLEIEVCNTGNFQFVEREYSDAVGLRNLKERLKILYQGKARFEISNIRKNIVKAQIILPKIKVHDPVLVN